MSKKYLPTLKPLCIYHGNCADGFGAAWVVWKYFQGDVDLYAGVYQEPPPDVGGRDVIIADFSYKLPVMQDVLDRCNTLLWLDHHKSAIEGTETWLKALNCLDETRLRVMLDESRSGAMLVWDHFFPGRAAPKLLQHIQDRDLWQFKLAGTEDIQAGLFSYPYDMPIWDKLMDVENENDGTVGLSVQTLLEDGKAITRKHKKDIVELLKVTGRRMKIGGYDVPVANLPYTMSSDAGHIMGVGEPFAACYYDTPAGRCFSLRSALDGVDVSQIAKGFGGGGHKHAAGFRVVLGWEGDS